MPHSALRRWSSQRLIYMTPPWRDAMRYTAQLTDRMGMELGIAGSPGFSESGGPWVRPAQAMKKLVWSETTIEGGRKFSGHCRRLPGTWARCRICHYRNFVPAGSHAAVVLCR